MDDMDESEVDDAECDGLSYGEAAAVDGYESVVDVVVLWRRMPSGLAVVEAMVHG